MMVECKTHGLSSGVLVSPDLATRDHTLCTFKSKQIQMLAYIYLGEHVDWFYVSSLFMEEQNLGTKDIGVQPLPQDYPEWQRKCVPECAKCFYEMVNPENIERLAGQ